MNDISDAEFLTRVAKYEKSLVQSWRPPPAEAPPEPWVDPVTKQPLPSPWLTGDTAAQELLLRISPRLAAHFMAMAKAPYQHLARLHDEATRRDKLSALDYNSKTHAGNVLRFDDQEAIGKFIEGNDPIVVEVFRAERLPVRCCWSPASMNRTQLSEAIQGDR